MLGTLSTSNETIMRSKIDSLKCFVVRSIGSVIWQVGVVAVAVDLRERYCRIGRATPTPADSADSILGQRR